MGHTFVKDVMKIPVVSIDQSMTVKDAATMMDDSDVGCIVITKENKPVGILTERDFVKRVLFKGISPSALVSEAMSSPIKAISQSETVWEAAEAMKINKIHKLPVIEDGKLVGIITTTDLVKLCSLGSDSEMRRIADSILMRIKNNPHILE